jgi:hypothetical protein
MSFPMTEWTRQHGFLIVGHRLKAAVKSLLSTRWFKVSAGLVFVLLLALVASAWYFRIWSWRDLQVYKMMSRECHPVWKDLHFGRIYSGQDVEEIIAATKPQRVDRCGGFVILSYQKSISGEGICFTGVTITAKNGRLACACAWSCGWDRLFFDELTEADQKAFSDAWEAHWRPIREQRELEERWRLNRQKLEELEREAAADPGGR